MNKFETLLELMKKLIEEYKTEGAEALKRYDLSKEAKFDEE